MSTQARLQIEMVDPSGHVMWSEEPVVTSEGFEVRFGLVIVDYTTSGDGMTSVRGQFSGYLKVTVLDIDAAQQGAKR